MTFVVDISGTTDSFRPSSENPDHESTIQKALAWLITQRETNWGWRNDTPKALTALQLVSNDDVGVALPTPVEIQLSAKQMEVEIVVLLWRHHEIPIMPPKLAQ